MSKKQTSILILVVIISIFFALAGYAYFNKKIKVKIKEENNIKIEEKKELDSLVIYYKKLSDHARYFTLYNAVSKYYGFITSGEYEKALTILDEDYILENDITIYNLLEKENLEKQLYSLFLEEIYGSNIGESYFIKGILNETQTIFMYVKLYEEELIFSIRPVTEVEYIKKDIYE